jgi:hypothetical protein
MSRLTRRRVGRVAGVRAIGDAFSDAQSLNQTFHATDYVPADIQNDFSTGLGYYNQLQSASQGVSVVKGTVQLSDQATNLILDGTIVALQAVPVLGQAFAIFMAVAPQAGAGPGTCAQPPAGPAPSQLRAWPHYTSWASFFGGGYPAPAPGSFEAFADSALQYNWELLANCFPQHYVPAPFLLGALVASWNATHAGPTRTITRTGLNSSSTWGLPPGWDPIADALEQAILAKARAAAPPVTGPISFEQAAAQTASAPKDVTSSFAVNAGPMIQRTITLRLKPPPAPAPASPLIRAPAPSTGSGGAVAALAVLALGGAWVLLRKRRHEPIIPRGLRRALHI